MSVHQLQPSNPDDGHYTLNGVGALDNKKLLFNATTNDLSNWKGDGSVIADWATFPGVANANTAIKVFFDMMDTYTIRVGLSVCNNYVDTTSIFGGVGQDGPSLLCTTGTTRAHQHGTGHGIHKMQCFDKMRFFPLHPVMSGLPTSIIQNKPNIIRLTCVGSEYPDRSLENPWQIITGAQGNNYLVNINNQVGDDPYRTPQNIFAPSNVATTANPEGTKCMMMIKSRKLELSNITPSAPASGSSNLVQIQDFAPDDGGAIYQANLPVAMFAQIDPAVPATITVDFPVGDHPPDYQPHLPSFVVEIQNLPLSGYLGKGFDESEFKNLKGMGSRLPIVGVVPAKEFRELQTDPIVNYYYQTAYYQPTQVRLPTEQSFYSLDINLRDIVSGELLRDLIHSSEVILRIYDLGKGSEMRAR